MSAYLSAFGAKRTCRDRVVYRPGVPVARSARDIFGRSAPRIRWRQHPLETVSDRQRSSGRIRRTGFMEYWHDVRGSVRFRTREFHHLCPLLGFVGDELTE